jgi:hypothetical protein
MGSYPTWYRVLSNIVIRYISNGEMEGAMSASGRND